MRRQNGVAALLLAIGIGWLASGAATERAPWYGRAAELELRTTYGYGWYDRVDTGAGTVPRLSDDNYFNVSLAAALERWAGEVELLSAGTSFRDFAVSHGRGTVRYQLTNDCIGDPLSVTAGLSLTFPEASARRDISLGYHGDVEVDGHLAFGRELVCNPCWLVRQWTVIGLGYAGRGAPWSSLECNLDAEWCAHHRLRAFVAGLVGWGDEDLVLPPLFRRYATVNHRSIDWGVAYEYVVDYWGTLNIDYCQRVYAPNYP